jgi:hypothetical protein
MKVKYGMSMNFFAEKPLGYRQLCETEEEGG